MRLVIADRGPINYLILIGLSDLLPALFDRIVLPTTVQGELASAKAPSAVRHWVTPPDWLEISNTPQGQPEDPTLTGIDAGEKAPIQLALSLHADLVLMDNRKGVRAANKKGLAVIGTLGILDLAARQGLVSFSEAVDRLQQTTFRLPKATVESLLNEHEQDI